MKQLIIRILRLLRIYKNPETPKTPSTTTEPTTQQTTTDNPQTRSTMENSENADMAGKTLHALLIAIDNYPIFHHRLNGCVNDRNAFKDFLERRFDASSMHINIKTLTDAEATKAGVIDGFQHFSNAKDGDICVFYFSGHGSRAKSPKEFWHLDPDRMNESLVCFDSRVQDGKDLMDKELSQLFWEATNNKDLHFATIFDCCHSGTISRNVAIQEEGVTARMAEPSHAPNRVEDYYGYQNFVHEEVNGRLELTPRSGKIIQLAASKEDETAKELRINDQSRGIFTYNLIQVLEQTNGIIKYADLESILRVRVANRVNKQTPQLIADDSSLRNSFFLDGQYSTLPNYYNLNFSNNLWTIDGGLIHGIPAEGGSLELEDGQIVQIGKVEANRSLIQGNLNLDPEKTYKAFATGISFPKQKIGVITEGLSEDTVTQLKQAFIDEVPVYIEFEEEVKQADYLIKGYKDALILTLPGDDAPLFKRVSPISEITIKAFLDQIDSVAKWKNLLDLKNGRSSIKDDEIDIQLSIITEPGNEEDSAQEKQLDWSKSNLFPYQYNQSDEQWYRPSFRLSIRNTSTRVLYASALNMQADFMISNRFLPYAELNPGAEASWLIDIADNVRYRTIPLELPDAFLSWGKTEIKEYVKFIISTDPTLSTDDYEQDALELDINEDFINKRAGRGGRGKAPSGHDWVTKEVEMVIVRPMESYKLASNSTTRLLNDQLSIVVPEGVSGEVSLMGMQEATRALSDNFDAVDATEGNRGLFGSKKRKSSVADPTSNVWGEQQNSEVFTFGDKASSSDLSVLELKDIQGASNVSADNPIKLQLGQPLDANEFVVPMGFDKATGLYYPLGSTDEAGDIVIESLPADEDAETATRSLGRSLKLFFHKIVLQPLGFESNWPRLAMINFEATEGEDFKYHTDKEDIKSAIGSATNIVLFIHGIIGNTELMVQSVRRMTNEDGTPYLAPYDLVLSFDYENLVTEIQDTSKLLKEALASVGLDDQHDKNFTIIAHSMGGLVSRWFIEKEAGNAVVSRLIMCGTPNNGSPWANVKELATVLLTYALNGSALVKVYTIPLIILKRLAKSLFVTLDQMHPEKSEFLKKLNDGTDPGIPYTILMGDTLKVGNTEVDYEKVLARVVDKFMDFTYQALHSFLFKTANDIAVAEASAITFKKEEGWSKEVDKIIVPCDHLSYFTDPDALKALKEIVDK